MNSLSLQFASLLAFCCYLTLTLAATCGISKSKCDLNLRPNVKLSRYNIVRTCDCEVNYYCNVW